MPTVQALQASKLVILVKRCGLVAVSCKHLPKFNHINRVHEFSC